jgi:hypothetical protein
MPAFPRSAWERIERPLRGPVIAPAPIMPTFRHAKTCHYCVKTVSESWPAARFDSPGLQPIVAWQRRLGERCRCLDAAGKLGARGDPAAFFFLTLGKNRGNGRKENGRKENRNPYALFSFLLLRLRHGLVRLIRVDGNGPPSVILARTSVSPYHACC